MTQTSAARLPVPQERDTVPFPPEGLDPRMDILNIEETAHRIAEGLREGVSVRGARVKETAELAERVATRFDAYDAALASARRAREAAEERSRDLEVRIAAIQADAEQALAEADRRHQDAMAQAEAGHAAAMAAADESHKQDITRLSEGLDRIKEEMGRRFMRLEEENAGLVADVARKEGENESLHRSMRMLIGAVEDSARSLHDDDDALGSAMAGVRERAADGDLPPGVVRMPLRLARPEA